MSPEELAVTFLCRIESKYGDDCRPYRKDPRVDRIVDALGRLGVEADELLGYGSFGVAASTRDSHVLKITSDPAEVQVGAYLVGKNLRHVVAVYGAWFMRDVEVQMAYEVDAEGLPIVKSYRCGILVEQWMEPIRASMREALSEFVMAWKSQTENHPNDYANLPEHEKRESLREASTELTMALTGESLRLVRVGKDERALLFRHVADGVRELHDIGIYAIDVHGGNVGQDPVTQKYRVFDVGVGSPPPEARHPETIGPSPVGPEPTTRREGRPKQPGHVRAGLALAGAVGGAGPVGEL